MEMLVGGLDLASRQRVGRDGFDVSLTETEVWWETQLRSTTVIREGTEAELRGPSGELTTSAKLRL